MNVLITGGASGLGEAITKRFARADDNTVYFTYNTSSDNAKKITEQFKNSKAIFCDLNDPISLDQLIKNIPALNLDLLVHNAYQGKFIDTYFHKTSLEDFQESFQTNILPLISITQACIEVFRKKKSGIILTILSEVLEGLPPVGSSVYAATKGYLEQLVKCWSAENKKFNIISGAVSPGLMLTSLTRQMDERLIDQFKEASPQKRLLLPEETADMIFRLAYEPEKLNGRNIKIQA
jgi:3-oxoacyl-[acyl-carrier protein] reductase